MYIEAQYLVVVDEIEKCKKRNKVLKEKLSKYQEEKKSKEEEVKSIQEELCNSIKQVLDSMEEVKSLT